ncbi:hypothetical protein ACIOHB_37275 [Streptomyces microflavus]|uniref:hypothetical protein n=1 Tax=Streptomyces microflavus TaxID=1919 RepID=UPI0038084410
MSKVIYLDQNHWITMARARYAPEKIQKAEEREAATALWELAATGQVRLPLSMAHLVETAHRGLKSSRRRLARAMLGGYGGWHMLNPLVVRRYELVGAFSGTKLTATDVFTTAANSPFFNYTPSISVAAPTAAHRPDGLSWQVAWASALLEDTLSPEELAASNAVIERWAATLSTLAQYMRDHPGDRDIRLVTAAHMLGDQGRDIAQALLIAGIGSENVSALLNEETVVDFFARLPFNGGVLEITQARLRNASDKWVRNDLNDLFYLACAAGYADHVVAEKKTGVFLQQASRGLNTPRALVHVNLRSLVHDLQTPQETGRHP